MKLPLLPGSVVPGLVADPVPYLAPNLHKDLEGVRVLEGGSGQIDKKNDPKLTHCSDAFGYYVVAEFPVDAEDRVSAFSMESII